MKQHTKHGNTQMQKRGRSDLDLCVIRKYGEMHRGGGIYMLSRRNAKREIDRWRQWLKRQQNAPKFSRRVALVRRIIASLEKTVNWMIITALESGGKKLITVYLADRKRQRKFMSGRCRSVLPSK